MANTDPQHRLVRIKPYNKSKGHLVRTFIWKSFKYQERLGWYRVNTALAMELAKHKQPSGMDIGIFDVKTIDEAEQIQAQEHAREQASAAPSAPIDATQQSGRTRRRPAPAEAVSEAEEAANVETADDEDLAEIDRRIKEAEKAEAAADAANLDSEEASQPAASPPKKRRSRKRSKRSS